MGDVGGRHTARQSVEPSGRWSGPVATSQVLFVTAWR
jgi:hypothetical protein